MCLVSNSLHIQEILVKKNAFLVMDQACIKENRTLLAVLFLCGWMVFPKDEEKEEKKIQADHAITNEEKEVTEKIK